MRSPAWTISPIGKRPQAFGLQRKSAERKNLNYCREFNKNVNEASRARHVTNDQFSRELDIVREAHIHDFRGRLQNRLVGDLLLLHFHKKLSQIDVLDIT